MRQWQWWHCSSISSGASGGGVAARGIEDAAKAVQLDALRAALALEVLKELGCPRRREAAQARVLCACTPEHATLCTGGC